MIGRDGIAGLAAGAASLALFWLTLGLERNPLVPIGPGFYPRIVLGATAGLAFLLFAADVLARRRRRPAPAAAERLDYALVAWSFAVFGAYVLALPYLGFRISTFFFVAGLNALLAPPRRPAQWARAGALGLAATLATWLVFELYLQVLMPRGRWTDF